MSDLAALHAEAHEGRRRFLDLVAEVRPDLHRYCARMTGSITEGEDIVQETLARAWFALPELVAPPPLRPWLFRIAHDRAVDHLRRHERRAARPLELAPDVADDGPDAEALLDRAEAVGIALSRFAALPPAQRSAVILKDVLGHSLDDVAALLDLTLPAVKAALHRGRARLAEPTPEAPEPAPAAASPVLARYVELFNARDWPGVRAMLADDVRLDLVSRSRRAGRAEVGGYVTNYAALDDWRLSPAWLEGREVIAVHRSPDAPRPGYFIEVAFEGGRVRSIRDYRYVPYIAREAAIALPDGVGVVRVIE